MGPAPDFFDLLFHGRGHGHRIAEDDKQVVFDQFAVFIECFVHAGDDYLLDFRSRPVLGDLRQLRDIEFFQIIVPFVR